jgi:hypothetical protein
LPGGAEENLSQKNQYFSPNFEEKAYRIFNMNNNYFTTMSGR